MRNKRNSWLSTSSTLAMILFLSACAVGPDFEKPEAPKVKNYVEGIQAQKTVSAEGSAGAAQKLVEGQDIAGTWWTLFHSQPLNKLIDQALANNQGLQAAQASLREAQDTLYSGEGALFPDITASGSATRQKTSGSTGTSKSKGSIYNLYNTSVGVSYTFDLFGGARRGVEVLESQADYQRFQLEGTYLSLTANVVTTAVQEASLRAQIAATQQIADAQRKQLEMIQKQLALGAVARSAVLAQESSLAATEAGLPALEKALAQTRHLLSVLVGQFPGEALEASFTLDSLTLPEELPLTLPSKIVEQRPDIQAAQALLHKANASVGVATAEMLPRITLSADLGSAASKLGDLLKPGGGLWSLAGSVSQPLFQGGTLFYQREAAKDALEAAQATYRQTVLTAFQDVADTLKALEMDAKSLKAQAASEKAAASSLVIAEKQFQTGAISYLGLLSAQQSYQTAKIAYVKAQATRYADTAALFQALGGGWWNRTEDIEDVSKAEGKIEKSAVTQPAPNAAKDAAKDEKKEPTTNKQSAEDGAKI